MATRRPSASSPVSPNVDDSDNPFHDNPNVFSDNYAESIAESFADSIDARSVNQQDHGDVIASSPDTVVASGFDSSRRPSVPSPWAASNVRGSLRKSMATGNGPANSDNTNSQTSPFADPPSNTASMTHRSPSSASTYSFARSQSSSSSDTGPSHPYAMYPQGLAVSRSASTATASTVRSPGFAGRQGPTHPYALYPQNVAEDSETLQQSIPVGFPGHSNDSFQHSIGPEGEVQDIIGPDGHSEQLPPYSRYPDESNAKVAAAQPLLPSIGEGANEPASPEHAFLYPRRPHNYDESRPEPSDQLLPHNEQVQPKHEDQDLSWKEMSWSERRKQKVMGISLCSFILIMVGIVIVATISGGVIGGILGSHSANEEDEHRQWVNETTSARVEKVTVTSMIDAAEITATPSALPNLPAGFFQIDVAEATSTSRQCLSDNGQQKTWTCNMQPEILRLQVDTQGQYPTLSLSSFAVDGALQYGAQPPSVKNQTLKLAKDLNNPEFGVAYQFQILYDKLVILNGSDLAPLPQSKRSPGYGWVPPWVARKQISVAEEPWFCYWNKTLLEGFIYVQNDTIAQAASAASTRAVLSSTAPTTLPPAKTTSPIANLLSSYPPIYFTSPYPDGYLESSDSPGMMPSPSPSPSNSLGEPAGIIQPRQATLDECKPYPKRIKIEERRLRQAEPISYCQQMQNVRGVMVNKVNEKGEPIYVKLDEKDPASQPELQEMGDTPNVRKRALPTDGCYCQWQIL